MSDTIKQTVTKLAQGVTAAQQSAANQPTVDTSKIWADQQALDQQKMSNLEAQAKQYGQGTIDLQAAHKAAAQALRARSDQALAGASRGMLGGGRGLALTQQAGLTRGAAEGEQASLQAKELQQARLAQLGAEGELLAEKEKMLQKAAMSRQRANDAINQAKKIMDEEAGKQWVTFNDEDRARVANQVRQQLLASEADPTVRAALENWILQLLGGQIDASGLVG